MIYSQINPAEVGGFQRLTKKRIFKEGQEVMLDTLMNNCGHHKHFDDCNCNNGYGCLHPKNEEDRDCPSKHGCKGCFGYACPLAYQKNPEKDDKETRWGDETLMVLTKDIYEIKEVSSHSSTH